MPPSISSPRASRWKTRLPEVFAAVFAIGLIAYFLPRSKSEIDPMVSMPLLAMEAVAGKPLYFNGAAGEWLKWKRPELLGSDDPATSAEKLRAFAQAVLDPPSFRRLDRQYRFEALLLLGDPSEYRPLLDHLLATKDFRPVYVDHWAIILRRDAARSWQAEDFAPVRAKIARLEKSERAKCLARAATKLAALRMFPESQALLEEARQLDEKSKEVWSGYATLHMNRGEWQDAMTCADRALAGGSKPLSALAVKTQVLYATKHFSEAYELSKQLIGRLPDDPNLLFYHAKIAHEANAYKAEIEVLEKLIARAEADARPVSGYQLYLAQAYAAAGDAPRAVEAFMRVLNDPELPQDQRDFARENIARIKKRAGL